MFRKLARPRQVAVFAISFFVFAGSLVRFAFVSDANTESPAVVPIIGATKTAALVAGNGDADADPGETLEYTITINNTGPDPALNTVMTDTLAGPQTLVAGSLLVSPIAVNDTYASIGNVGITVPDGASDLLGNDTNPNGAGTLTIVAPVPTTSTQGGVVAINTTTGQFTYNPPAGFEGTDTFVYTLDNGTGLTNTATVTITVSGMIWFVQTGAAAGGDGRLATPFNCFVGTNCFDDSVLDQAGDNIFLYSGAYTGGQTLLANQRLIGQGATAALAGAGSVTGITIPTFSNALPATGGARPTITTTAAATSALTLGSGNTLRGFNIGNTTAVDITGTGFGTLTALEIDLNGTGRLLDLTTGTLAATFDTLTSTNAAGGAGVNLTAVGGTLTVTGTTSITLAGSQGINMSGSSVVANFGTSTTITDPVTQGILVGTQTGNVSFGNTTVSDATDAISLQNNSAGTRTFGTITTTNGTGDSFVHAVGGGITTITGLATLTNPGGNCIDIQDSTMAVTFANVNCTASAAAGVFLDDNSGAVTFADLDIDTDANVRAFHATDTTAASASGTITTTSGTIADTGTAKAVEIVGAAAAFQTPLNMTLTTVSSTGAASGIILTNTSSSGAPGGFRILGTGGACTVATPTCTGGTIQNSTDSGIKVTNVTGLSLTSLRIMNNGNGVTDDDEGMKLANLLGTASITSTLVTGSSHHNVFLDNTSGTLASLTITGSTFNSAVGGNGMLFRAIGTAAVTSVSVTTNTFSDNQVTGMHVISEDTATVTLFTASGNTFTDANAADGLSQEIAMDFNTNDTGNLTFKALNNTLTGHNSHAMNIATGAGAGTGGIFNGTIDGNTIGNQAVIDSGSKIGNGMRLNINGQANARIKVNNNTLRQIPTARGIEAIARNGTGGANFIITNNTIVAPTGTTGIGCGPGVLCPLAPIHVQSNAATIGNTVCSVVSGNTAFDPASFPAGGEFSVQLQETSTSTHNYEGNVAMTALQNLTNANPAAVTKSVVGAVAVVAAGTCTQPPPFAPPGEEEPANIASGFDSNLSFLNTPLTNAQLTMHNAQLPFDTAQSPWISSEFRVPSSELEAGTDLAQSYGESTATYAESSATYGDKSATYDDKLATYADKSATYDNKSAAYYHKLAAFAAEIGEMISPTVYAQREGPPKGGTPNAPETGETVTTAAFMLPASETVTVKFRATVDNGPYASGVNNITNQAAVSGNFTTVNTNITTIALDAAPDLSVTKTEGGSTTQPGVAVVYTLSYSNVTAVNGQDAVNVQLTETVPANTTFNATASLPSVWSCADGSPATTVCTLNVGALNAGANGSATFAVNVLGALPAGAVQVSNSSSIAENPNVNGTDRVPANNTGADTTNIIGNWDGSASTDWFTAANWSNDTVPPAGNSVSVPNVTNQPIVTGADVTLNNLVLNGENMTITAGRVVTANASVTLGANIIDGAGTLALGTSATITRTTGQVQSNLRKAFGGLGLFTFPVGTNTTQFSPVNVNVTAGTGELIVRANTGNPPLAPVPLNPATTLQRYWTLSGSGITSNITFNYLQPDVAGNEAAYNIIRVTGGTIAVRYAPNGTTRILNTAANTFTLVGMTSYSDWTAGEPLAPTAANAVVSGRVINGQGRGVPFARVTITDEIGNPRYTTANAFGYYRLAGIPTGQSYVIGADHKRFNFASRIVVVNEDLAGVDFVAEPEE